MSMLLEQFDTIFDTQASIEKLQELILDMAVKGKLVPQDLNDEPAGVLLERIKEEKELLIKEKKIKKQKLLPETKEEEILYELPKGWKWVRLGDLVLEILGGGTPSKSNSAYWNGDIPWASVKDIKKLYIASTQDTITLEGLANSSAKLIAKQNIILCTRMGLGKICINAIDMAINQDLKAVYLPKTVDKLYFVYWYKGLKIEGTGTTVKGIRQDQLLNLSFPLPPLNEQKRIVKKVNQLMSFCEELKKRLEKKQKREERLNVSVFSSLEQSLTPEELKGNLQFILTNLSSICTEKKHVQQLRNAILSLAVRGRLVPQDKNDEPASIWLKKIAIEKEKLITEKKIKKEKSLPLISKEEEPYELAEGWEWVRLGDITCKLGAGSTPRGGNEVYGDTGVKFIRSQNVWNNGLLLDNVVYIPEEIHLKMKGSTVIKNDILLNITGGSIGRACVVPEDFDTGNVNQHVAIVRLVDKTINDYIHLILISPYVQELIRSVEVGISREGLSMTKLKQFPIPIPPLNEQKRIVEKVLQFMTLFEMLEKRIENTNEQRERLLQSILHQVFYPKDKDLIEA